jgi:Holliday junction resolvasome RuvABC endonuclease subunit
MSIYFCIDPGFRAIGLVVFDSEKDEILNWGALLSPKSEYDDLKGEVGASKADAAFIERIAEWLNAFDLYDPEIVFMELPSGGQSFRAVKALALVTGAVIGWAKTNGKKLIYYSQGKNKYYATGESNGSKEALQLTVRKTWPTAGWSDLPEKELNHICDAAALILAARGEGDI